MDRLPGEEPGLAGVGQPRRGEVFGARACRAPIKIDRVEGRCAGGHRTSVPDRYARRWPEAARAWRACRAPMTQERGVDLDAFVSEHGAEWNRLNTLSRKRRRKLTATDIDELVALYRRTATHLSVVRSRSADPTLVAWLSRLVLQARASVTPSTGFSVAAIGRFFQITFPAAVYRSGAWCVGVGLAFLALAG